MTIREEKIREKVVAIKARQDESILKAVEEYEELKKQRKTGG
jgi:hypothetical protein